MTDIEHLHKILLSMIKYIDELCIKNKIEYYLIGGSAIGAIRHHGFIPWDDDLDIIMTNNNYNKFISICQTQLDTEKYWLQIGLKDWPMNFSKLRLKKTHINEIEDYKIDGMYDGIYIDIFKMDNVSNNPIVGRWQYLCGKYYLCYQLRNRTYLSATFKKQLMITISAPLKISIIRKFVISQIEMYNKKNTPLLGFFYGRTRWKSGVISRQIFGKPTYVDFEDTKLPVPEHCHEYLTQAFGNYMELPPIEKREGIHIISIDFGPY